MKIKKTFQGSLPENKILNSNSTSQTDTYSCAKINEMTEEIYSTEEQVIGKWIDGKPLYRKIIEGIAPETTVNGTYISSVVNIADNIDMATIVYAFVVTKDNIIINLPYIIGEGHQVKVQISSDRLLTIYNGIKGYSNASLVACLEYTKTTD